jgi:hypothetical protein
MTNFNINIVTKYGFKLHRYTKTTVLLKKKNKLSYLTWLNLYVAVTIVCTKCLNIQAFFPQRIFALYMILKINIEYFRKDNQQFCPYNAAKGV